MSCFWTDLVGVVEDCGGAPVSYGYAYLDNINGGNGWGALNGIVMGDTFEEVSAYADSGGTPPAPFTDCTVVDIAVYQVSPGNDAACAWLNYLPSTHDDQVPGTEVFPDNPGRTWEAADFFIQGATGASTDPIDITMTGGPGDGNYPAVTLDMLSAACGLPTGKNGAFVITVRHNPTGRLYRGSGVTSTCF